VSEIPEDVRALAGEREEARRRRDFAAADALRERIHQAGFEVTDTPSGWNLVPAAVKPAGEPPVYSRSGDVPSVLHTPPIFDGPTLQWVVQGWADDVRRSLSSVTRTASGPFRAVIVDAAATGALDWYRNHEVIHVAPSVGWAAAQNAGLRRAVSNVVIVVDGSVEFADDGVSRLYQALQDPTVGITGPFGLVTEDLHEFHEGPGPDVDAIEGYVMAFRRDLVERGLRFDEKFKFYRSADIELSFQIKAMGLRATVTPIRVIRREHRMWANTAPEERARLSKRNFYRFLDTWRGRTDLLVSSPG
jgi:cysteinyl-tRNA synthetase